MLGCMSITIISFQYVRMYVYNYNQFCKTIPFERLNHLICKNIIPNCIPKCMELNIIISRSRNYSEFCAVYTLADLKETLLGN